MGETVNSVNAATLGGRAAQDTLGFYSEVDRSVSLNTNFTDVQKMNDIYDNSAASGFHPSRGNKSGTEAVTYHELGHALTDRLAGKMGAKDLDDAASRIVKAAYKESGQKGGNKGFAKTISGYATTNYAECVAEAVADWYCNGNKAKTASKLIMAEMKKYA